MPPSAQQADAASSEGATGWKLDREQRRTLLEQFPPAYADVVADHVTRSAPGSKDADLPPPTTGAIVGRIDDGRGVEAMVVAIGGCTARPGHGTYHVTWSLGPGRTAKESNDVLAAGTWAEFDTPVPITLTPARLS